MPAEISPLAFTETGLKGTLDRPFSRVAIVPFGKTTGDCCIGAREAEAVLERIVIAQARIPAAILERAVIDAVSAADHKLRSKLVSKPKPWREIILLDFAQTRTISIRVDEVDSIFGEQSVKLGESGGSPFASQG